MTTATMTMRERAVYRDMRDEDRRLTRELRRALDQMDVQSKTTVLLFVRELIQPGSVYQAIYDDAVKVLRL